MKSEVDDRAGIYRISLVGSDRVYIGQARKISVRVKDHVRRLKNGNHYNARLQRDFDDLGGSSLLIETILVCAPDKLVLLMYEQAAVDGIGPAGLYNVRIECVASPLGTKQTASSRSKKSAALLGRKRTQEEIAKSAKSRTGMRWSEAAKRALSLTMTGRKLSEAHRKSLSVAFRGRKLRPVSDESRARMSAAKAGKARGPLSEQTKLKIGAAHRGKVVSDEARRKMSEAQKRRFNTTEAPL
jgi:group I intron endonuclease